MKPIHVLSFLVFLLTAVTSEAAAAAAAAGGVDDDGGGGGATLTSRRALKELHLPALISETGTSEVVGKGTPRRGRGRGAGGDIDAASEEGDDAADADADADAHETLSTGITKSLIRKTAVDNVVIVTWANNHYRDFARFWISRLRALGKENFMVGAMDAELHAYMRDLGVATWHMGSKGIDKTAVKNDFGWGSQNFHKMGRDKIRLIRDFTKSGVDVLISDIDVAWLRDPTPFFLRYPAADILVSTDMLRSEINIQPDKQGPHMVDGEGLEFHICHAPSNIGIMWFRSTKGSQQLTEEWVRRIEKDDKLWDQNAFNDLKSLDGGCSYTPDGSGLGPGYGGKVMVGVLPVSQFSNGHTFHVQRTHTQVGLAPYAVHNTFQYGGTPGKRHRMREANAWLGDEEVGYFDAPGGYLSYTPHIPSDVDLKQFSERSHPAARDDTFPPIETPSDPIVEAHGKLVTFQLQQMKQAAAVAAALGRVLILPPVLCGLDRVWFPHFGRFPGSQFALPFVCPLDHVINLERLDASKFREYTFLTHPELPEEIRTSVAVVNVEGGDDDERTTTFPHDVKQCHQGPGTGARAKDGEGEKCGWLGLAKDPSVAMRRARITEGQMSPDELKAALGGVRSSKVLHFDSVVPMMRHNQAHRGWEKEYNRVHLVPDAWCCSKSGHRMYTV